MGSNQEFDFLVLTPAGAPDAALAIAASRAGAVGVLNLEFVEDSAPALAALRRLAAYGRGRCGVLLDGTADDLLAALLAEAPAGLEVLLLTASAPTRLAAQVEAVHRAGRRAALVVTSLEEARAGEAAGVDALVAKGHEAGGWVGEETAFVLLQRLIGRVGLPIWVQGGVGLHTAAACQVAGAAGAVLDSQVLLARESPLPEEVRARIASMDGSETLCLGAAFGAPFRAYSRPNLAVVEEVRQLETALTISQEERPDRQQAWRAAIRPRVGWRGADQTLLALGQDAAFAAGLARRFRTVGGILTGLRQAMAEHREQARRCRPLAEGAPLAQSHGTRYPIVQGPMTRVSDRAAFALEVAGGGALPFLALALMRAPEVEALLAETREHLGDRPWGVGILGFVPPELRAEQMEVIRAYRPPFALIAGGRPDQARALEQEGTPTYLHVPSPGLLRMFLQEGARRFVFEGRECGGHVGPRTSFVLWESMVEVLLEALPAGADASRYHVLFAGGIHDGRSAAMVAALAAPLAERGVRVGVLLGTAYLFTEEAVRAGAITPGFQEAALRCERTALLESGPGHATRCVPSPFVEEFEQEKRRLLQSELKPEEIRGHLEMLNIGRLRIAAKGVDRHPRFGQDPGAPKLVELSPEEQWARGMYMIGQVAALRDRVCSIAELHEEVATGSQRQLEAGPEPLLAEEAPAPPPAAVAIVGMACILPGAPDLRTLWANILNKVDAITEVPPNRWDWRRYYDPERAARDRIYSRWGGFIDDVPFDPVVYGMPPSSLPSIEPFQLLALAVVHAALHDAGYLDRPFPRERTSVVLGAGGGGGDLTGGYVVRASLPMLFGESAAELTEELKNALPEWTEDSFPGILMNVAAGRVANRFDLGGVNFTVDAACASSLAAVYLGVRDLEARTCDVAVVGGVDAIQNPFAFLCFAKTQALSASGRCRPFDAQADGIAISEGFAAIILKRLEDAERDGDRIYAVIRGVGGASDGRDRSLTAPRPEGQMRALRRAYAQARISPATVELIEAHGTGTVAGDQAEVQALTTFFGQAGAECQRCAIGSIKSMIGHTKATAGVAGLVKVALALYHRVLPPTLGVTQPNPRANFPASPFYVNSETRPWIHSQTTYPRRAGISAFGFGGTDFHVVVEEYVGDYLPPTSAVLDPWPAELFIWRGRTPAEVLAAIDDLTARLVQGARPRLADLASTVTLQADATEAGGPTLSIVATSLDDLQEKLSKARARLQSGVDRFHDAAGLHYAERPLAVAGQIAFLFPGQGSQYINMAREIAVVFPEARACFERADRALADRLEQPLSRYIFPPPAFDPATEQAQQRALTETNVAQPALGATDLAYFHLLRELGVVPQMVAGHSYGEFVALCAAGAFGEEVLFQLSEARGRFIREGASGESGTMAAVRAAPEQLQPLLADPDLTLANLNAPKQTVISGTRASVERAIAWCAEQGIQAQPLPVACAFHSPLVAPAQRRLAELLQQVAIARPRIPVFSNTTGATYPDDPAAIVDLLAEHLVRPVRFVEEIEAMYEAGARVFVEVGPRHVLSGLVGRILGERPHICTPLDQPGRPGPVQLLHSLATLAAEGVPLRCERLYQGRAVRRLDLSALERETGQPTYSPTTWLVNGGYARPLKQRERTSGAAARPIRVTVVDGTASAVAAGPAGVATGEERPAGGNGRPAAAPALAGAGAVAPPGPRDGRGTALVASGHSPAAGAEVGGDMAQPTALSPLAQTLASPHSQSADGAQGAPMVRTAPVPRGVPGDHAAVVMQQFQQVMQRFLQTQRAVMLAYLGVQEATPGSAGTLPSVPAGAAPPLIAPAPPSPVPAPAGSDTPPPARFTPDATSHTGNGALAPPPGDAGQPLALSEVEATNGRAEAPPASSATLPPTREQITAQLLAVVSERTGYPTEMLALDADLEADLGIDSIKRVEIAGTIIRALPLPPGNAPDVEKLTGSRTLRQVIDILESLVTPAAPAAAPAPAAAVGTGAEAESRHPFDDEAAGAAIGRFELRWMPRPPGGASAGLAPAGVVVIVDDATGVGEHLAARLLGQGHPVARVLPPGTAGHDPEAFAADPSRPEEVERLLEQIRARYGPPCALVHLAALRPGAEAIGLDPGRWQARLEADLISLFLLARGLQADLEGAARRGGAAVVAATALGGGFASVGAVEAGFPGHGAIAGFLKTLAQEWPAVRVKAVDLALPVPERAADWLLAELAAADGVVEVGYRDGERGVLELVPAPLADHDLPPPLDSNSVILVTGGARGITAEVALRLAERYRPTLLLVGRTPPPNTPEPAATAGLAEPQALKRALMQQLRQEGTPLTPARVEERYRRLLQEREVRDNLARLGRSGARVAYLPCDVRDAGAFAALIEEIYRTYGRLDGVIHGAGIIEDKLVRDKHVDSFQRVLATKVTSTLVLASTLRPEGLRFLVLFSSVSGRFGNRGQGDYAAASEVLNKLAHQLDRRWPGRVVAINWGPWRKTGMVAPEVARQFAERGVVLIPPEVGCRKLEEELRFGRKGEAEIVIGGAAGPAASETPRASGAAPAVLAAGRASLPLPLLAAVGTITRGAEGQVEVLRTLDLEHDLYLDDHRLDGRPVFPFAMAIELMAEVAAAGWPSLQVRAVREIRVLRGIVLESGRLPLRVVARPRAGAGPGLVAEVAIVAQDDPQRVHYQALVELGETADGPPGPTAAGDGAASDILAGAGPLPMSIAQAYRQWLFHGPRFQHIAAVEAIGPRGAQATLRPSVPRACLRGEPPGAWLMDPVLVDSAFQMQVLWSRLHWDLTLLPARVAEIRRLWPVPAEGPAGEIRYELRIRPHSQTPICHADHVFYGPDGRPIGAITDAEGTGSKALNRLAGRSER